ncbi:hypothetical protein ASE26_09745 [Duganella sp. Root198D2]|nr:hypothetical protein ASD07_03070 [Duganella sp. Root336D2]KRB84334.1 hypothetical protein ASE26_09745 [Duganella sp. Root198D2]
MAPHGGFVRVAAQDHGNFVLLQELIQGLLRSVGYGQAESCPCLCMVDDQYADFTCFAWFKHGVKQLQLRAEAASCIAALDGIGANVGIRIKFNQG